jgi:hypothetical protein
VFAARSRSGTNGSPRIAQLISESNENSENRLRFPSLSFVVSFDLDLRFVFVFLRKRVEFWTRVAISILVVILLSFLMFFICSTFFGVNILPSSFQPSLHQRVFLISIARNPAIHNSEHFLLSNFEGMTVSRARMHLSLKKCSIECNGIVFNHNPNFFRSTAISIRSHKSFSIHTNHILTTTALHSLRNSYPLPIYSIIPFRRPAPRDHT